MKSIQDRDKAERRKNELSLTQILIGLEASWKQPLLMLTIMKKHSKLSILRDKLRLYMNPTLEIYKTMMKKKK